MIAIALRTLRFHKGGFIASFIALFFGAVIVVGCGGLLETGIRNAAPPERLAAAPIVVTGDQRYHGTIEELVFPERIRLDAKLTGKVAEVPGVAAAVPDVSFPVSLDGRKLTGHGWSSARLSPYRLVEGAAPSGDGQVVLGARLAERAGLRPGGQVELLLGGGAQRYEVTGLAAGAGDEGTVFLSDAAAARPGKIDSIGVLTAPGADPERVAQGVRKVVDGPITVLTGDDRGQAENPGVLADGGDLIPLAAAFGGLSALVTVFAVSGALGLSVQRRQRELALLRAVGTTPGQLRRLILGETMILAMIATGLAWYPGPWFGEWLLGAFADGGVVPDTIAFRSGSVPLIVGMGTALCTALGAAFIAANRAARTRPAEALAEASVQPHRFSVVRLAAGVLCLGGGGALAVGTAGSDGPDASGVATPAVLVWAIGFGLLGPVLSRATGAVLRRPMRAFGLAGHLATGNVRARTARLAAAVMPVMLASGLALGLTYMQTTQSDGARQAFEESLRADLVVTSDAGGVPLDLVGTVGRLPGVAAASAQVPSTGYIEPEGPVAESDGEEESAGPQPTEVPLQGVSAGGVGGTTAFRASTGSLDRLHGRTVALPARYAGGHETGDTIPMRLGDGTRIGLTLVATVGGRRGYETALVPASLLVPHTDSGLAPRIMVSTASGTDRAELAAALSDRPGVRVTGQDALTAAWDERDDTQASMAYLVLAVVVGYAVIALVNTQIQATAERRREFMLLRLVGATRRQVLHMMTMEAVLVTAAGLLLGGLVAALTLVPLSLSVLGSVMPSGSAWILVTVVGAALGLTVATTVLAAGNVLRGRPGEAAGVRE